MRKRIEEHFEDIKDATETEQSPTLPPELADWVVGVCDEVRVRPRARTLPRRPALTSIATEWCAQASALVREVPPTLRAKLAPTARYLSLTKGD